MRIAKSVGKNLAEGRWVSNKWIGWRDAVVVGDRVARKRTTKRIDTHHRAKRAVEPLQLRWFTNPDRTKVASANVEQSVIRVTG